MLRSGGGVAGPAGPPGATGAPGAPGGESGSYLLSGGGIFWKGTGYQYTVAAAEYVINGVEYASAQTDITLTAADGTNDRIDLFVLTTSGTAIKVDGTAAAAPAEPVPDPLTQLKLSSAYVATGSTSATIGSTVIYDENNDWTSSVSGGTIVANSTSNPNAGTLCIEATAATAGHYVQLADASAFDTTTRNTLVFYIRSKASWASAKTLVIQWYSSTTARGTPVALRTGVYGFNSSTVGSYQLVVIPMSAFGVAGVSVDRIRMTVTGGGSAMGFYVDDITMQGGVQQNVTTNGMVFRGAYSSAVQYVINDVVTYGTGQGLYVANQSTLGVAPTGTGWTLLSMRNPMTTGGDVIYGGSSGLPTRLANGSSGQVLTSAGGTAAPTWSTPTAGAFMGAKAYLNTTQSIPNDNSANVSFNTEEFDTNAIHDNSTNPTRFTIPVGGDGYWTAVGGCGWSTHASGIRLMRWLKNGADIRGSETRFLPGSATIVVQQTIAQSVSVVAGDYLELNIYQNSGAELSVGHASDTELQCAAAAWRIGT